jgi:hypothetical protein
MGLLDKVKEQAEQTAVKAREGVEDIQAKRELSQAYTELGKTTFELLERGEVSHAELQPTVDRINELNAGLSGESDANPGTG